MTHLVSPCALCDAPCGVGLPYGPSGFRGGPLGRPFSPRGAVLDNALADVTSWPTGPCSPKLPCSMKTHSNYNRYPCSPDVYRHGVGYGGRFGGRSMAVTVTVTVTVILGEPDQDRLVFNDGSHNMCRYENPHVLYRQPVSAAFEASAALVRVII